MKGREDYVEEDKKNIHGIKIGNFNMTMIVLMCSIYLVLAVLTMDVYMSHTKVEDSTKSYITYEQIADQLREGSDYLTEQVRVFAETGDLKYAESYFNEVNVTRLRDKALKKLEKMNADISLREELAHAMSCSNDLMETEYYSMRLTAAAYGIPVQRLPKELRSVKLTAEDEALTRHQQEQKSCALVYGAEYRGYKAEIYGHLDALMKKILSQTQKEITKNTQLLTKSLHQNRIMLVTLFLLNLIMFIFLILLVIRPLKIYLKNVENDSLFEITGAYEFKYLALTYNSIYEINAANRAKLRYTAEHDKLTGVLNRTAFDSLIPYLEKSQTAIALIVMDVDQFKSVNDTYGHEIGDAVLQKAAKLIQSHTRSGDHVVRYGGDEFVVIMTEMTKENAHVVSRKIDEINALLLNPKDGLPPVSLSAGAAFAESGYDDSVFKKADEAMYQVKREGRCGCSFAE